MGLGIIFFGILLLVSLLDSVKVALALGFGWVYFGFGEGYTAAACQNLVTLCLSYPIARYLARFLQ